MKLNNIVCKDYVSCELANKIANKIINLYNEFGAVISIAIDITNKAQVGIFTDSLFKILHQCVDKGFIYDNIIFINNKYEGIK